MKLLALSLTLAFFAGCNSKSNPYPTDGVITRNPQQQPWEARPALGIDTQDLMSFDEGKETEYRVSVKVPKGNPILDWQGLPQGAYYDATKGALVWLPNYFDANDSTNPSIKTREYPVVLVLSSDADRVTSIRKTILLQVHDTARPVVINGMRNDYSLTEGESLELARFNVSSEDFPSSDDIKMSLKNSTPGLKLSRGDRSGEWVLKAQYGYDAVKVGTGCTSSWNCELKIKDALVAQIPDGRLSESSFELTIKDKRQDVSVSLAKDIDVAGDMSVSFTAIDGNQEISPLIKVTTAPPVGVFKIKKTSQKSALAPDYQAQYEMSWTQLPPEAMGQTYTVVLQACNSTISWQVNNSSCSNISVNLKVEQREITPPTIARGDWSQSVIKYVQPGKAFTSRVDISAGRAELRILSQTVQSSDSEDEVKLNGANLKITSNKPGVKTVTINVVNSIGGIATGVFLYEVLPLNWGSNVVIGTASAVNEFTALEILLGSASRSYLGGFNYDSRALAYRKSVTAGTHSLSLPDGATDLAFFAKSLDKVLVTTPMHTALPEAVVNELRSHGVYLAGRASAQAGFKLSEFDLIPARKLGLPTGATGLLGTLTTQSADPALLSLTMSSDCERLFSLFKPGSPPTELLVGVSCPRKNGGKLVVLGFEWSDIKISEPDAALPAQWFKKMME
ncbi:MAG: hypothetical protein K2P81_12955 [Bacteriovoracaceae bacterium]|nr:hypothetical protein [Bacteriovoracaceae bacterium]